MTFNVIKLCTLKGEFPNELRQHIENITSLLFVERAEGKKQR